MASKLNDILTGIKTVIEAALATDGFEVMIFGVEPNRTPAAVVRRIDINNQVTIGGQTFDGTLILEVLVNSTDMDNAYELLEEYITTGNAKSIEDAIDANPTLTNKVDFITLDRIQNIGMHIYPSGAAYLGADMIWRFVKQA